MPRKKKTLDFEILGMDDIIGFFDELGKVPQVSVNKAAKAGATHVKRRVEVDADLPVDFGLMKRSIIAVNERTGSSGRNRSGKAVYIVTFDRKYTDFFKKRIKEPGKYGGKNPDGYYPASMEFGFLTAKGGVGGHFFLRKVGERERSTAEGKMMEVLSKDIDRIKKTKITNYDKKG